MVKSTKLETDDTKIPPKLVSITTKKYKSTIKVNGKLDLKKNAPPFIRWSHLYSKIMTRSHAFYPLGTFLSQPMDPHPPVGVFTAANRHGYILIILNLYSCSESDIFGLSASASR